MRIAACVEYSGKSYHGWQRQNHANSVQACVEEALSKVAAHPVSVVCAGRTDAGVHGVGQVIHFDTEARRDMRAWVYGGNSNLPKSIAITWAKEVDERFHARFSALSRSYRYVIFNREVRPSFLAWRTTWEYRPLDVARMQEAAQHLIGEHDFTSYRALACQAKSPVRNVMRLEVSRREDLVLIDIEANAFLHHMVRNIAGVLMTIGAGEQEPLWAKEVLEHRDRTLGGVTAHPSGLYFMGVKYPDEFAIPAPAPTAMVW
ncbi:MAG: tRNA pseudouridine(38-40) synthase TruA [Pseudomonadota bacterium]